MEKDELFIVQLRDCFTAGYTLPQYCIDNGIKKPLFVFEGKFLLFVWEIYVQFRYDKRIFPHFGVINAPATSINFSPDSTLLNPLNCYNISQINLRNHDKIFFLTSAKLNIELKNAIYLDKLVNQFIKKIYLEIPALHFLQRHPKVKLFLTKIPNNIERYIGGAEFCKTLTETGLLGVKIQNNTGGNIPIPLDKFGYTNQDVFNLIHVAIRGIKTNIDGSTFMIDTDKPLIKIQNGRRMTAYQPEKFLNKIFFVGPCHYLGSYAPFDKTIESFLQKMLNENNLPYRVENEGQTYSSRYQDIFYNLDNLNAQPGDIIFIWFKNWLTNNVPSVDFRDAFDPPHDYKEIFVDKSHVNELGYKILAEKYFKFLTENNFFRNVEFDYHMSPPAYHRYGIPPQFEGGGSKSFVNEELEAYKKTLREKKIQIGALVMNCNPFTLGHLHLVEYAAARVTKLYIFVVEEDKSEFPFADRIELVRQGVKNFSNVEVLPSGKFIISQQTFSGYFNKASLQDVQVDSSQDVEIFATEIAPTLGITIRFAGEEPKDNVTRQYNETMKEILPRHGVEFCEIPRKNFGDEPISASSVREALKAGDFDKIKNLVPETTLFYLRGRYSVTK